MSRNHRKEAYAELSRRYRAIFSYYWHRRHQLGEKSLTAKEAEFLPAALSLQAKPVSPTARLLAVTLMALVAIAIAWAFLGRIDIVVSASGRIIPRGYSKTIASVDLASVRALYVEEGQKVKAGDVLIELDTSASDAEREKATASGSAAKLQAARAKALIEAIDSGRLPSFPPVDGVPDEAWQTARLYLDGEYRDLVAKLRRISSSAEHYERELEIATQRAEDYKSLLADHDVSQHAWLEKEQSRVELEGKLTDTRRQYSALIAETRHAALEQLTEANKIVLASQQDALRSSAHSDLLTLRAPIDGTVQQLDVHTVGGVVAAAKPLMQIVPSESTVDVEAFLENKDVGFVAEGQDVAVKVDAFDYTKYGTIAGKVSHISRDAIRDEKRGLIYSTKISLGGSSIAVGGKAMRLSAGMSVNVEIKTGDRRIAEYVLSPLLQHKRESLNER